MMPALLLLVPVVPLVAALLVWAPGPLRRHGCAIAPWTGVPPLLLSLTALPDEPFVVTWLLLGTLVGLDTVARLFLFFTALVWTLAGVHARAYVRAEQHRYFFFHLLALSGNLGLIVAQDLASFYLFFALMTFSAYGLVVHDGTPAAYRAGRVYVVMAVVGETLLLAAFLLAAATAPSLALADIRAAAADAPQGPLLVALLLAGFGIKAGAVPLHMWLPLAHPVAPTPASAVLSGCMIKAGVLGWLRFLPLGEAALPAWGQVVIVLGVGAAFFGVAIGVTQRNPKTVLAYSSVSQMGIINVAIGIGLSDPDAWQFALPAIPIYAMHHGLAKSALFLGVSVAGYPAGGRSRRLLLAGLALPALALAGAPLTSGAIAKTALKDAAATAPGAWADWLHVALPLAAVGTTVLMARFLAVVIPTAGTSRSPGVLLPWMLAVIASAIVPWIVLPQIGVGIELWNALHPSSLWLATWPILAGAAIAIAVVTVTRRKGLAVPREIAPGDILVPLEDLWARTRRRPIADVPVAGVHGPPDPVASLASSWYGLFAQSTPGDRLARMEAALVRWEAATALMIGLMTVLWLVTQ
jgi:formate hydrogenlyase subunit 3/multisubunit Na+/H+ antiporter MnhD subunit